MGWTNEQQAAISTRDRTLLVSAAAGSGKTATLTERIIQSILDDKNPADIGRMLIATYTNAAVDELRDRIGKAIKKASAEHPENHRLEEQLLKLKDAKILTITSFCNGILRASAESVGLAPNYRIAEPPEAKILASSVLDGLINAAYEGEIPEVASPEEFISLADSLSNIKYSEGLAETIAYIFEKLTYTETGIDTLLPFVNEYDPKNFTSVDDTRYGKYIMDLTREMLSEYREAFVKIIRLASTERIDERNLPKAESEIAFIESCERAKSYEELRLALSLYSAPKFNRTGKEEPTDFYVSVGTMHKYFNADIKKFSSDFFTYSTEEWQELYTKLYNLLGILYRFLKKYNDVFMDAKRRRGIVEFSDVERFAYLALYEKDGSLTPLAKELSEKFDAIYVDEYQDVNGLQSKVFSAISKENNRFMVGDIKQSIYCFRSARPEIFAGMKESFPMLGADNDYPAASIFMSNNFRCDKPVVDFVNGIFDTTFGMLGKNIGYVPEDRLKFSKVYRDGESPRGHIPEIHILDKPKRAKEDTESEDYDPIAEAIDEEKSANEIQAEAIAKKISELIGKATLANGKLAEAKDIAILMRSVSGDLAACIKDALKRHGIGSSIAENGNLFMCNEVLLALSLLYCIDNPKKEVYLTAIMLSPLFDFTADDLIRIKYEGGEDNLWDSLIACVKANPEDKKLTAFVRELTSYRHLAEGLSTDELIAELYRRTGLFALGERNGGGDNLILLHSYAKKYESTDFKGLYSFINYVNALIEGEQEYPAASGADEADAVRIMTIHKSKGLEFPITILAGASNAFGGGEGRIIFSDNFGISMSTKDDTGLALVDNPTNHAVAHFIRRGEFDEELRVLYVALTRAREMLYVYAISPKGSAEEYVESIDVLRGVLSPYIATKAKSFLDLILMTKSCGKIICEAASGDAGNNSRDEATSGDAGNNSRDDAVSIDGSSQNNESLKPALTDECQSSAESALTSEDYYERFTFVYPYSEFETLPEKISVSSLSPTVLDESENTELTLDQLLYENACETDGTDNSHEPGTLPKFITGTDSRESARAGIATHTFMQFCNFDNLTANGVDAELDRLVMLEFISEDDKKRVRKNELNAFLSSDLFSEMRAAKHLYREMRFNVKLPAERFASDPERKEGLLGAKILVQGVIDCIIEDENGNLHLVDYKTDRLTKEERQNKELGDARMREKHSLQLSYYKSAIEIMFGKAPEKIGVYSLHLGREVEIRDCDIKG